MNSPRSSTQARGVAVIFFTALIFHFWALLIGWNHVNLPGCEFRQAQTAISALFIQKDHNFSVAYPTPILGPPWSIPLEFPLYQWTVVAVSNFTHSSLVFAARAVSASCFYLSLPAFYLLLGQLKLGHSYRFVALTFLLTCPIYIFYARAFLIETMALMFGAWYLLAMIRSMQSRTSGWLLLANVAGTGVGLVKVTTFFVFLIPAFALSIFWLWRDRSWKTRSDRRRFLLTFAWLLSLHVIPFALTYGWITYSDGIKALNFAGRELSSSALNQYNFGFGLHFSPVIWQRHFEIIFREIAGPISLTGLALLSVLFARKWIVWMISAVAIFFAVQFLFPALYAWHDYYYVAIAFAPLLAFGLLCISLFQNPRLGNIVPFAALLLFNASQIATYFRGDYKDQRNDGNPGGGLAQAIKLFTAPDDTLIIVGEDWNSIIPYYSGRKASMVFRSHENDNDYIEQILKRLSGYPVGALLLTGDQKHNQSLADLADQILDIDNRPVFTWLDYITVYIPRRNWTSVTDQIRGAQIHGIAPAPQNSLLKPACAGRVIAYPALNPRYQALFRTMTPRPVKFFSTIGPQLLEENGGRTLRFSVHPETRLWFDLKKGPHRLQTTLELLPAAYENVAWKDASDGVEIIGTVVAPDQSRVVIQRLYINPRDHPEDRKAHVIDWTFDLPTDAQLELEINAGPQHQPARDWAVIDLLTIT